MDGTPCVEYDDVTRARANRARGSRVDGGGSAAMVLLDLPVADVDDPVRMSGNVGLVRDEHALAAGIRRATAKVRLVARRLPGCCHIGLAIGETLSQIRITRCNDDPIRNPLFVHESLYEFMVEPGDARRFLKRMRRRSRRRQFA